MQNNTRKIMVMFLMLVFMLGSVTTAFAARPFANVPAKHWAYDALSKLAAGGIVDGYNDKGDKTITRYEMAIIVGKAMEKIEQADKDQKVLIEKLAAEFSDELKSLGVSVVNTTAPGQGTTRFGKLSQLPVNPVEKFTYTGRSYLFFASTKIGNTPATTDDKIKTDLKYQFKVNDKWSLVGESVWGRKMNTSAAVTTYNDEWTQMYVAGKVGKATIEGGVFKYPSPLNIVMAGVITGTQVSYGNEVKDVNVTVLSGRVSANPDTATYKSPRISSILVAGTINKTILARAAYVRVQPNVNQATTSNDYQAYLVNHGNKDINYYTVRFDTQLGDWNLMNAFSTSDAQGKTSKSGFMSKYIYKYADINVPGSSEAYIMFRRAPYLASYITLNDWIANTQGFRIGANYIIDKNVRLGAWFSKANDIDTHIKKVKICTQLDVYY